MSRSGLFDDETPDLSQFTTKQNEAAYPAADVVRRVADAGGFPSRAVPAPAREPMTYRTGRTATLTVKTTPSALETFYGIARKRGWKVGETFERAVELLLKQESE